MNFEFSSQPSSPMYPMRRSRQKMSGERTRKILEEGSHGVLSLALHDIPYGIPLNYVLAGNRVYFHSAAQGRKVEIFAGNPLGSFCVVAMDQIVPETFTSHFRSAIAFGKIRIVEEEAEKKAALYLLCDKYCPGVDLERTSQEINSGLARVMIYALEIEEISGKEAIELVDRS